jgi:hypothetical protein
MLLRNTLLLAFGIFLFSITKTGEMAEAQAPLKDPKAAALSIMPWKVIDGFRSAKFGMDEKQVMRAIIKDLKISRNNIKRDVHAIQKTANFKILTPNLMPFGGTAQIIYVFGYKSKKLIEVNIDWGKSAGNTSNKKDLVNAANFLRYHFTKKKYKEEGFVLNAKIDDHTLIAFRGKDKKDRMILLQLLFSKIKVDGKKKKQAKNLSLKLSYIQDSIKSDVFKAKTK